MKKLSRNEWIASILAVVVIAYLFFAGDIMSYINSNIQNPALLNSSNELNLNGQLLINDIAVGGGDMVNEGDLVTVHYILSLADGTTIGNSRDFGVPFSFVLGAGEVIPGFDQGLRGMKVGGVRTIMIPPELGYGEAGFGPIPPNSTLVFTVEILSTESEMVVTE